MALSYGAQKVWRRLGRWWQVAASGSDCGTRWRLPPVLPCVRPRPGPRRFPRRAALPGFCFLFAPEGRPGARLGTQGIVDEASKPERPQRRIW